MFFSPIWPHVNENEKKNRRKSKLQNFENQKKKKNVCSVDIVKGYLSTKFVLMYLTGSQKTGFTDGR